MIEYIRQQPRLVRTVTAIVAIFFTAGLFLGGGQSSQQTNYGRRHINPKVIFNHAQELHTQNPDHSIETIYHHLIAQQNQKHKVAYEIEKSGLIPSKEALKRIKKALKEQDLTLEEIARTKQATVTDVLQEISDNEASAMLRSAIATSEITTQHGTTLKQTASTQKQHTLDINLSKSTPKINPEKLKKYYNTLKTKPTSPPILEFEYVQLSSEEYSSTDIQAIRKYGFKNPDRIDQLAKHFDARLQSYKGPLPDYLTEDILEQSWVQDHYISDVIPHGSDKIIMQIHKVRPQKTLSLEECQETIKQAYFESRVLPRLISQLSAYESESEIQNYANERKLTLEKNTEESDIIFPSTHDSTYTDGSGDIHWIKLINAQPGTTTEAPLENLMVERILLAQ
ncbi:hypothetical protein MMH89_01835 [Candidatus Comchoanobacter bicostacola]|uniref:Peptidylprolyl isomerase n=1 Tax=Candidatus Comchoanobacter bicostacola TaxID=2919598 RepID=A0ABY5DKX1_9GAMM|nr:hypothetical protein [Candidatus Comchoanobacter bicostacola]UTC24891.1 hypothetical protein MMH89_01835 [Candidatus Comchoanobacter bicostacola]